MTRKELWDAYSELADLTVKRIRGDFQMQDVERHFAKWHGATELNRFIVSDRPAGIISQEEMQELHERVVMAYHRRKDDL